MVTKNSIDETILPLLNRSMDAFTLRQRAIANNVANAEVPGYRRVEVEFEEHLREVLRKHDQLLTRTDSDHLPDPQAVENIPVLMRDAPDDESSGSGLNGVDIDQEMASLAKAMLAFRFSSRMTRNEFDMLRKAITGSSF
jgi:flagellar basal-body rod protein FlgB